MARRTADAEAAAALLGLDVHYTNRYDQASLYLVKEASVNSR